MHQCAVWKRPFLSDWIDLVHDVRQWEQSMMMKRDYIKNDFMVIIKKTSSTSGTIGPTLYASGHVTGNIGLKKLPGRHQAVFRQSSGSHQAVIRLLIIHLVINLNCTSLCPSLCHKSYHNNLSHFFKKIQISFFIWKFKKL